MACNIANTDETIKLSRLTEKDLQLRFPEHQTRFLHLREIVDAIEVTDEAATECDEIETRHSSSGALIERIENLARKLNGVVRAVPDAGHSLLHAQPEVWVDTLSEA